MAGQWWWCTPLVPALGRQRQADLSEFEASLVYQASSRTARIVTQKNNVSKKKKDKKSKNWVCRTGYVGSPVGFLPSYVQDLISSSHRTVKKEEKKPRYGGSKSLVTCRKSYISTMSKSILTNCGVGLLSEVLVKELSSSVFYSCEETP